MNHSYEEIRDITSEALLDHSGLSQYAQLKAKVAQLFKQRGEEFTREDGEVFREVFSELFRSGIIIMGLNESNPNFPFFTFSRFGIKLLEQRNPYFFHDVSSYEKVILQIIPEIDDLTMLYLKEAMQAYRTGCLLSASVMLGVATEHTFFKLLESIQGNKNIKDTYKNVFEEHQILSKFNKFRRILEQKQKELPPDLREDLETTFLGILSIIRTYRNESGHPTGKIITREQCYVLLNIFPNYCKKVYEMIRYFKKLKNKGTS